MVTSLKPIADGNAWLIYLYNPTAATQPVALQFDPHMRVAIRKSDAFGHANESSSSPITIPANGSMYLRVDRANPQ
jgi:hypothetical protein